MAEVSESNPVVDFQKTVSAQNEKIEAAEQPTSLKDRLLGRYVGGFVDSNFSRGRGGSVRTDLTSGDAGLHQNWSFDKDGMLESVRVSRSMKTGGSSYNITEISLERGGDGKFQVSTSKSTGSLGAWAKEFHTAKARMEASRK